MSEDGRDAGIPEDLRVRVTEECSSPLAHLEPGRQYAADVTRIRQERDMLLAMLENIPTQVAYLDSQFNFVWANAAYARGSGHRREELIGRNHFALFPNPENQAIFEQARETGQPVEFHAKPFEFVDQPERGTTYWDWTLAPLYDDKGHVQGLLLSLQEVTERQRAEQARNRALGEARQRQEEISALSAASRAILRYRAFGPAARFIYDSCKHLIGARAGCVALRSEEGTESDLLFLDLGNAICAADSSLPMPIRELGERAYRTGQAVCENNLTDSEWTEGLEHGHAAIDSALFVPLLVDRIVVGFLGLLNRVGGFTPHDVRIALAFGELASIALLNSRTLASLQDREERFRAVAQTASDAIITIDSQGHIIFWNEAATRIFGYGPDEARGKPLDLIMPGQFRQEHQEAVERAVATGGSYLLGQTVQMVGLGKDGREFPIELSLSRWEIGEGVFFTGIVRDIADRVRAENALKTSQARWQSLVDNVPNFVTIVGRGGTVEFINHTVPGIAPKDVIGHKVYDFVQPEYRDLAKLKIENVFASGETDYYLSAALGPEGTVAWYDNHLGPIKQGGEVVAVTIVGTDITERKEAEETIQSLARFPSENRSPVLRVAQDGTILYANEASAPLLTEWASRVGRGLPDAWRQVVVDAISSGEGLTKDAVCEDRTFSIDVTPVAEAAYANLYGRDITEQVQAEALLREQNQFIINALEALNHPFCVIDANDYSIKIANSAAGRDDLPEAVTCYALTHRRSTPCGTEECPCLLEEIKKTRKPVITEHIHYDSEGRPRHCEVHGHPVFDSSGNINQVIEYTLDITERKWWEEALQRERDFTSAVLDTAGALVIVLDPEGRIVRLNRACERLTGYAFDEVQGQHFWDILLVPEELAAVKTVFAELRAGQFPSTHENVWVARDGSHRTIAWSNTALVDGAGGVEYVIGTGIDVTERRRAEEALRKARDELELRVEERTRELQEANWVLETEIAEHRQTTETLRESEERYRRLVELSFQGILIQRSGKIVSINPAGARLLGAACPEELVGTPLSDLFRPTCCESLQGCVEQGADVGAGVLLGEERVRCLDGSSVDVEVAAVPIFHQGQPAAQVVIRDLTARKQAELERARIARDLHDSLGHSLGYLHLKLDQLASGEKLAGATGLPQEVARMRDVASQAYEMVRGMLATLHPSNATDLATGLLAMAQAAGQRADFEVRLSSEGSASALHPVVQQQILFLFREALNNAVKHADAQQVGITLSWGESALTITMTDDGCGFGVGDLAGDGHYGLRMMQERADEINGQLTLSSRPDAGTQVTLRVPLSSRFRQVREW